MGDENFNATILNEKLSKLNSSAQSIESLSRWCISHRKKAKQVVETWEKLFKSAPHDQRVSLLYLSNDILQNSRRKGSEYVNEFWKVLPTSLKTAYDSGNESCRKVAFRLVDIWEERKVFGSRGQNLKNEMAGTNPSPVNNVKTSNPIKVMKRDATSVRIKIAVGGLPDKIVTGLQLVHDEAVNEEAALGKFHKAISSLQEIEKDVLHASSQGNPNGSDVVDNLEKQENMIKQCISELEKSEAVRVALVSQLREALQDQETKLEQIRSEISGAQVQIEQAANIRLQLALNPPAPPPINQAVVEPTFPDVIPTTNVTVTPTNPLASFVNSTVEESKKAAAAAVAAKLAASTSSAQMLTSILSSLVAEEAASKSSGLKRQKLEPSSYSDGKNPEGANSVYFSTSQQAMISMQPVQSSSTQNSSTQNVSQVNQLQAPFLPPPPPPPPLAPPSGNSPSNQMVPTNMMGLPYGYGANNLLPPSLSNAPTGGYARPSPPPQQTQPQHLQNQQPQQLQNQQPQQQQLQQPANGGYYRPVGIGFYGQSHQPPTPPIHRQ